MLGFGTATRVYLVAGATDLRFSFNGLYGIVKSKLESDPLSGHAFLFCNRRKNRLKVLFFDGSGLWVCAKRLEKGTFAWPQTKERSIELSREEMALLLGGIDLESTRRRPWYRRHAGSVDRQRKSEEKSHALTS